MTTNQVSALTGATLRQLQHWDEKGYVCPVLKGHRRIYSAEHVKLARFIMLARSKKISTILVQRVIPRAKEILSLANGSPVWIGFVHQPIPRLLATATAARLSEQAAQIAAPVSIMELRP